MKTPEEIEAELKYVATKEDLALLKADMHHELHAQTRQLVTWMVSWMIGVVVIILGGVYFMLSDIKNDIREIRNRLPVASSK